MPNILPLALNLSSASKSDEDDGFHHDSYPSVGHIPECIEAPVKGAVDRQSSYERWMLGYIGIQLECKGSAKDNAKEYLISPKKGAVPELDIKNAFGAFLELACRCWKRSEGTFSCYD